MSHLYQLQEDVIVRRWLPADFVENATSYQPTPTDTVIAGYPRSGTTWVSYIIYLLRSEGEQIGHAERLWEEHPEIGMGRHVSQKFGKYFVQLAEMAAHPRVLRTHLPYHKAPVHPLAKCIYVSRNPFDTCVSLFQELRAIREFTGSFSDFFTYFLHGQTDYNDYFAHVNGWNERRLHHPVLWITYEDLLTYPRSVIKQIGDYLGGEYQRCANDEFIVKRVLQHASFQAMKSHENLLVQRNPNRLTDAAFFRSGSFGDYRQVFDESQTEKIAERYRKEFGETKLFRYWERCQLPV